MYALMDKGDGNALEDIEDSDAGEDEEKDQDKNKVGKKGSKESASSAEVEFDLLKGGGSKGRLSVRGDVPARGHGKSL